MAVSALLDKVPGEKTPGNREEGGNAVQIGGWVESPDDLPIAVLNPLKLVNALVPFDG